MNSLAVNQSSTIRGALRRLEYQRVAITALSDQEQSNLEEEGSKVLQDVETVVSEVRNVVCDDILSEFTCLRNIK